MFDKQWIDNLMFEFLTKERNRMEPKIRMPYGKFKGKEMHEIPSRYLKWLAENVGGTLAVAADEEWRWRDNSI